MDRSLYLQSDKEGDDIHLTNNLLEKWCPVAFGVDGHEQGEPNDQCECGGDGYLPHEKDETVYGL